MGFNSAGRCTRFNTQPPEGGCSPLAKYMRVGVDVSTHSHPKVAAEKQQIDFDLVIVSTHSHPKVAACVFTEKPTRAICFNTQPPEGGCL